MKSLSNEELMSFCSQMAMILHAGISAIEGLAIMREDLPDGEGKRILDVLYEQMEQTGNLAESMKETKVFPEYVSSMTEIGEQTGRLDEVMDGLALHYERERDLMDTIKSALFYPAVMLGMLTGILHMGMLLSRYSMVFVGILILLAAGIVWLSATEKGRLAFRKWMGRSGFLGKTAEKIACSRVAEGLSLCMFSGLDLDQSLEMTEKLITQETMKKRIDQCRSMMAEGEGFDQALMKSGIFSGLYGKMISVGIRTGSVDQVMSKIAGEYGEAVVQSLEQKVAVVEPTLVAVLSVLVGLILISVMLPLMNIMSNLG